MKLKILCLAILGLGLMGCSGGGTPEANSAANSAANEAVNRPANVAVNVDVNSIPPEFRGVPKQMNANEIPPEFRGTPQTLKEPVPGIDPKNANIKIDPKGKPIPGIPMDNNIKGSGKPFSDSDSGPQPAVSPNGATPKAAAKGTPYAPPSSDPVTTTKPKP
jgi:hypothetical protein